MFFSFSFEMNDFQNLYEVRKTVRFNLLPVSHNYQKPSEKQFKEDLENFILQYKQVIEKFSEIVFAQDEDEKQILNRNTKISIAWLKTYAKQDFHTNRENLIKRKKNGQKANTYVSLEETEFLLERFQIFGEKNGEIIKNLELLKNQPLESQKRKSDFAYYVHQVQQRTNFVFVYEFFKNAQGKQSDTLITETLPLLKNCEKLLQNLENYLLPMQSFGQVIERTSLNYYTVNKKPKDYPKEIKNLKNKKDEKIYNLNKNQKFTIHQSLSSFLIKEIKNLDDEYFVAENFNGTEKFIKDWNHLKLQYAYKFLKEYKAQQKSKLFELVLGQKSQAMIMQEVPLFDFEDKKDGNGSVIKTKEDQFQDFYDACINIQNKSTEYEQSKDKKLKSEITTLKKKRGNDYFNVGDVKKTKCPFPKYITFCEFFKAVAMEYGRIKADIKSLEKEQIDAERLKSWSVLLEKENRHFVMTIPRDKKIKVFNEKEKKEIEEYQLPHVYRKIKQLKDSETPIWTLYHFESLTLRALEKLCFGMDKNSFITDPELSRELSSFTEYFENGKLKRKDQMIQKKTDGSFDESILIKFYQKILSLEATKKMILVKEYLPDEAIKKRFRETKFETLKEFQVALEKQCYIRKAIKISDQKKQELEKKYGANVYQITSYDLFAQRKNEEAHTKLWKQFWSQDEKSGYTTRLNPEMKISYVEKREDSIKDKEGNEVKRNRRKQAEYILSFTISENNNEPKFDMAFADKEKVKANIEAFNTTLNDKIKGNPYNLYYYGIDRGDEELLTLGIFKFEDQDISPSDSNKSGTYKKPIPIDLEVWELPKDKYLKLVPYNGTKYTEAYKNISYADKEGLLQKKTIQSCLDLTCAKIIGKKLVINGDIATLMNLKLENAKRKIIEGIDTLINVKTNKKGIKMAKIQHKPKSKNKAEHFELSITLEDGNTKSLIVYYIDSDFEKNKIQPELEKILQDFLTEIKNQGYISVNIPIVKINHLRYAICANAVGVLSHLQKKYFGMISFEDLEIKKKNEHFAQNNTNLGSRAEFALLRKFQTLGLVPPNYKMVMSLQSKKEINQLGIISYIKTAGTSSNCPHCEQSITDKVKKEHKWKNHKYKCDDGNGNSCGFSTYSESEIAQNAWSFSADKKGLDFLESSDDVAAYNIAKRGLELILKKPQS